MGAQNIVRAIVETNNHVDTVMAISTDKACKPVNTYGMCKAIQERLIIEANMICPRTRFIGVRYGNVMASRGSVIPLFREQIKNGGPVTITDKDMTRFLLNLDAAVGLIKDAITNAEPGDIYVPDIPSVKILDMAEIMIGRRDIKIEITGIRPGEKVHEILVSEEEIPRTIKRGKYYVICPILPGLRRAKIDRPALTSELSSGNNCLSRKDLKDFLKKEGFLDY
jgi:UDP-glucose 4-epimerase